MADKQYKNFQEFYPYYLSEHKDKTCRVLHVIGTTLVLLVLIYSIMTKNFIFMLALPFIGYGFAWIGHYFFEKNRPATFTYPAYSFMADWVMWWQILTGRLKL